MIHVYDGSAVGWVGVGPLLPQSRISIRQDFTAQTWDIYVDGELRMSDIGFAHPLNEYSYFNFDNVSLTQLYIDNLLISSNKPCSIRGNLINLSGESGIIRVVAVKSLSDWSTKYSLPWGWDAYSMLVEKGTYFIKAWIDLNDNQICDPGEPQGVHSVNQLNVDQDISGIDITIYPDDSDADGLPDWWEMEWFGDIFSQTGLDDSDSDALSNLNEYWCRSAPVNPDTDGDGMPDGWEAQNSLNPLRPGDASPDPDGDGLNNLQEFICGGSIGVVTRPDEHNILKLCVETPMQAP